MNFYLDTELPGNATLARCTEPVLPSPKNYGEVSDLFEEKGPTKGKRDPTALGYSQEGWI